MKLAVILSALLVVGCAANPPMKQGNVVSYEYSVFYVGFPDRDMSVCQTKRARIVGGVVRFEC